MNSTELLVLREAIDQIKELKYLVPTDTERNTNLKIDTQKNGLINNSHKVIKNTITVT